jgi:hypothetical protein
MPITNHPRRDFPSPTATALARTLLDTGWHLSGAAVRVIHTAALADESGLTIALTSEAGKVRLDFDAAPGGCRASWRATSDAALPVEILAAVSAANRSAADRDATTRAEATVGDVLTDAGWRRVGTDHWASSTAKAHVYRIHEGLDDSDALCWRIRRPGLSAVICASDDIPPTVIAAFALTEAPARR